MQISNTTFQFLNELTENNHKEWFTANKPRYEAIKSEVKTFSEALVDRMRLHDDIEKIKVFRIYRDVRFSKDKTPYKTNIAISMSRATKQLRGGYYLSLAPNGESMLGGGFFNPNKEDLLLIRKKIEQDDEPLRAILANKQFKSTFGELGGDKVKTAPKGFSKDHPAIDLIRHKSFIVSFNFEDAAVLQPDFLDQVVNGFLALRPFFDYMSEVLTTDLNGVPLYE